MKIADIKVGAQYAHKRGAKLHIYSLPQRVQVIETGLPFQIGYSWEQKFHKIGVLVLFLNDDGTPKKNNLGKETTIKIPAREIHMEWAEWAKDKALYDQMAKDRRERKEREENLNEQRREILNRHLPEGAKLSTWQTKVDLSSDTMLHLLDALVRQRDGETSKKQVERTETVRVSL